MVARLPMSPTQRRDKAIAELLTSEADYVRDLKLLVDVFLLPLERWAKELEAQREYDHDYSSDVDSSPDKWAPDFNQEDCNKIFANTLQLARFNRQFLLDLRKAHGGPFAPGNDVGFMSPVSNLKDWRKVTSVASAKGRERLMGDSHDNDHYKDKEEDPLEDPAQSPSSEKENEQGPRQMLEVFLKSAPFLKMYSEYVNNFDAARERLATLESDNLSFSAFLTACEKQKPCRGLRLRDFLILPVQRIPQYRMLLETILSHTAMESTMHSRVEESLSTMGGIASKINADISLRQQKSKVYQLQEEFGGASFVTPSRLFIKEGDLLKVARNGVEKLRFVLFNDLLVYGQAKRKRGLGRGLLRRGTDREQLYHHRRDINLNKCFVVDAPAYGTRCPSFLGETGMLVVSEEKSFMVMASTAVEKDGWLQAIRLCMRDLSASAAARERVHGGVKISNSKQTQQALDHRTAPRQQQPISGASSASSSPYGWSLTSTRNPLAASAPRSVWVPGKPGGHGHGLGYGYGGRASGQLRLVDFRLPAWAGVRMSCGCLSHTEVTWGKEGAPSGACAGVGLGLGGGGVIGAAARSLGAEGPASGSVGRGGSFPMWEGQQQGTEKDDVQQPGDEGSESDSPKRVSLEISMKPSEPMGLRLRDLHPECGGGVVVVGFERSAAGKKAGVLKGDRITEVDGFSVSTTADIVWALQQQQQRHAPEKAAPPFFGSGKENTGTAEVDGRKVVLTVLRGFPKSDKPWMPRLKVEPSPTGTVLTPPSSAVESPGSDEADVPSPELSAPGRKTFSGIGASGSSTLGFAGAKSARSAGGVTTAKIYAADEQPLLSAATVESGYGALPPSPETAVSTPARVQRPFGNNANRNMSGSETPIADAAAERKKQSYISTRASTVEIGNNNSSSTSSSTSSTSSSSMPVLLAVPARTPEATKNEDDSGDGGDSNGTGASSADSNGGGRAKGPAPTQTNANAGGDPAVPFASFRGGGRATPAATSSQPGEEQDQQGQQGQGGNEQRRSPSFLGLEVSSALAACWGGQAYDDEGGSRPAEFDLDEAEEVYDTPVHRPPPVLLAVASTSTSATNSTMAGGSVRDDASTGSGSGNGNGSGSGRKGRCGGDDDDFQDANSVASSTQSSLMLTAVSPSRVPPPLVSVASTLPLPPVSRASSVVSSSFSNPWHSPTAAGADADADAGAPDDDLDSMSWLKPLPTPPPREMIGGAPSSNMNTAQEHGQPRKQQDYVPLAASSSANMSASTTPLAIRAGTGGAYPSGRWVQTPLRGEILQPAQAEPKFGGSKPGSDEDTGSLD